MSIGRNTSIYPYRCFIFTHFIFVLYVALLLKIKTIKPFPASVFGCAVTLVNKTPVNTKATLLYSLLNSVSKECYFSKVRIRIKS